MKLTPLLLLITLLAGCQGKQKETKQAPKPDTASFIVEHSEIKK